MVMGIEHLMIVSVRNSMGLTTRPIMGGEVDQLINKKIIE